MVANEVGEAFVAGTTSDLPEDAPYQDGKSHPYAMWVDAKGKVRLRGRDFLRRRDRPAGGSPQDHWIAVCVSLLRGWPLLRRAL